MKRPSRREFLRTAAAGSVAASLPTTFLRAQERPQGADVPPSERVQIALIGAGGQGSSDTRTALRVPGTELTAGADIYDGRLTRAKGVWGSQIFTSRGYHEGVARPGVGARVIRAAHHWDPRVAVHAVK